MRSSILFLSAALALTTIGCDKDEEAEDVSNVGNGVDNGGGNNGGNGGGGTLTINSGSALQLTLDGVTTTYTADGINYQGINSYSGDLTTPPDSSTKIYGYGFSHNDDNGTPVFGLDFGKYHFLGSTPSNAVFFGYFAPAVRPYGDPDTQREKVKLTFYDNLDQPWSTSCTPGAQTGMSFQITDKIEYAQLHAVKVRATFTCKLYNCADPTQVKDASGIAVFSFENL